MAHWPFIIGAIGVVALLSAAATTLRSMTRFWMRHWVEAQLGPGGGSRSRAAGYLAQSHQLLATSTAAIAFVVALTGVLLGADTGPVTGRFVLNVFVVASGFLLLGQVLPRAVGRHWAPPLAVSLLPLLRLAALTLAPIMLVAGAGGRRGERQGASAGEERDEIEELLRDGELEGIGSPGELEFISEVVEFGEKQVGEVMTPRTAVTVIDRELGALDMARQVAESGFSRVPVFQGTPDEIIGIVHVFDVLATAGERWPALRPVVHVPAGKRCSELLFDMLAKQQHLAVVLDEHGGTIGIVTLEDLLEELVGDIRDEHDAAPAAVAPGAAPAVIEGSTPVFEVAARFDAPLVPEPHERAESIGGLLARRLKRIPVVGERVRLGGLDITVVEAEPSRIIRLLVQRATGAPVADLDGAR